MSAVYIALFLLITAVNGRVVAKVCGHPPSLGVWFLLVAPCVTWMLGRWSA